MRWIQSQKEKSEAKIDQMSFAAQKEIMTYLQIATLCYPKLFNKSVGVIHTLPVRIAQVKAELGKFGICGVIGTTIHRFAHQDGNGNLA